MDTQAFQNQGKFLMLALDHRGSFVKMLGSEADPRAAQALKHDIITSVIDQVSGVLIDKEYGLPAYHGFDKPFLLPLEKSGYTDQGGERLAEKELTATEIKNLGAQGVKLLVYFNPNLSSASDQIEFCQAALAECSATGMPLFLEIRVYDLASGDKMPQVGEMVIASVRKFLSENIKPAVFKLEYPDSADNCQVISDMLGPIPWILLTKGSTFEAFKTQLTDAMAHGCRGFLAGRALWQEIARLNAEDKQHFLSTILPDRFSQLANLALTH